MDATEIRRLRTRHEELYEAFRRDAAGPEEVGEMVAIEARLAQAAGQHGHDPFEEANDLGRCGA